MERIISATENDLIIIFSYTGSYFEYQNLREHIDNLRLPKIWMICGGNSSLPDFIDGRIRFASTGDQISHPYQLEAVESLLVQMYSIKFGNQ